MDNLSLETQQSPKRETSKSPPSMRFPAFFTYLGCAACSLVVAAILLQLGSRVILSVRHRFHRSTVTEFAPDNPAYFRYFWATECVEEHKLRVEKRHVYFPFRIWGVTDFHGRCVNNDVTDMGVVRRTINPPIPACATSSKTNIWVFGGSAVYGTGIPDWATLPSYLSRELSTTIECVKLINLGVEGYASNQELLFLMEQLKSGRHPDIVIFYDGFNDAGLETLPPGHPAAHMDFMAVKSRFEGSFAARFDFLRRLSTWQLATKFLGRKTPLRMPADDLRASAIATLNNYEENLRIARILGDAFGFKVYAFWQPAIVYGHKPLVPYEQQLLSLSSDDAFFQAMVPVYREAELRADKFGSFVFLGGIFDDVREPLYLDWVHLNPLGNELAGREVAKHIKKYLK